MPLSCTNQAPHLPPRGRVPRGPRPVDRPHQGGDQRTPRHHSPLCLATGAASYTHLLFLSSFLISLSLGSSLNLYLSLCVCL